jgi:integrase
VSVYQNNRGKWIYDIDDFFHADGTKEPRIRETAPYQSKAAAKQREREIRQGLVAGTYGSRAVVAIEAPTLSAYERVYMAKCEADRNKPKGLANYRSLLHKHLVPLLGDRRMDGFNVNDEDALKVRLKDLSASRYNQAAAVMNGMIELFHSRNKLKDEPFRFSRLGVTETSKPFYDFEQYAALRAAAGRIGVISELVVVLGRDAGLRRSEMWGLQPRDCYPGHIMVERAETLDGKKRFMGLPKGGKIRKVETTPDLRDVLARYRKKYGSRERMVAGSDGKPFNQESFETFMMAIQKAAGLEPTGEVHILRHTFCSHMAILGVPVTVIQKLAGHAQLATTLVYMHLAPGDTALGINALARGYSRAGGNATATAAE